MKRIFLLLLLTGAFGHSVAQTSLGLMIDFSAYELMDKPTVINNYFNIGVSLKKPLSTNINAVTGASYRFMDADMAALGANTTDLITFYRDQHPNEFYYISDMEYARFSYLSIPVGLEVKATTFLRFQYLLENNILIGSNATAAEFFQYGKKSVAPHMFTSNFNVMLHGNAVGIALGVILHPGILRNDLKYTYAFMNEFQKQFRDAYILRISIWGDMKFKKRKKVL